MLISNAYFLKGRSSERGRLFESRPIRSFTVTLWKILQLLLPVTLWSKQLQICYRHIVWSSRTYRNLGQIDHYVYNHVFDGRHAYANHQYQRTFFELEIVMHKSIFYLCRYEFDRLPSPPPRNVCPAPGLLHNRKCPGAGPIKDDVPGAGHLHQLAFKHENC